ncbi:MAG: acetate--CoA ligase family protein [Gemmatimonadota bacterium]|nr:MAG: acetate--CoA ligase family protein [Gemmatimonadota bacterium]
MSESRAGSLQVIFEPRSIAVIGASRRVDTIGYVILDSLLRDGYAGAVYPVNPYASVVHSMRAYPSIREVPGPVDLAVIVVPKAHVLQVAEECGAAGVSGLVVISAGFREVGGEGVTRERELAALVRKYGMRMVGPNCMGVLNTDPAISMNATFAPTTPPVGNVAFLSQSGAMGVTILDYAREYGIGVSKFISMGNKADISGNDVLEYLRHDDRTSVILMYLENFGNPRHFTRIAREVTQEKAVVAVKAARTRAGARAATSHTGALAGRDVATDALFAQCGVIRVDTVEELFDMAMGFGNAPLPKGDRVAVVTNAGGPGIIIADALESHHLEVAEFTEGTRERLRQSLPEEASVNNPVDMIASADADSYRAVLETVLEDPGVDAVIASFVPPLGVQAADVARAITDTAAGREQPAFAVLMGRKGLQESRDLLHAASVPAFIFPESAVRALVGMSRYRRWLERPAGEVRRFEDVDRARASRIVEGAQAADRLRLNEADALALLEAYGVPVVPSRPAHSADEAVQAAKEVGFPVVLKVMAPSVSHKSDVGGVIVGLQSAREVRGGFYEIMDRLAEHGVEAEAIEGVLVQGMVQGGREAIIGTAFDPSFGPLIMFGLGGIYVEALGDVVFRVHPVTDIDAAEMVRQVKGYRLLEGVRGEKGVDLALLEETIQRISQMVGDFPQISELDINPFVAFAPGERSLALDARVLLGGEPPQGHSGRAAAE